MKTCKCCGQEIALYRVYTQSNHVVVGVTFLNDNVQAVTLGWIGGGDECALMDTKNSLKVKAFLGPGSWCQLAE